MKAAHIYILECPACRMRARVEVDATLPEVCVGCGHRGLDKVFCGVDEEDADNRLPVRKEVPHEAVQTGH